MYNPRSEQNPYVQTLPIRPKCRLMFLSLAKLIPLVCFTSPALYGIVVAKKLEAGLLMGLRKPCDRLCNITGELWGLASTVTQVGKFCSLKVEDAHPHLYLQVGAATLSPKP